MKLYYILSLIPALSYMLLKSKKQMHMLQQNWYNDGNRYVNWVISNFKKVFLLPELIVFSLFFARYIDPMTLAWIVIFIYIGCYFLYDNNMKKEQTKKPLVFTPRIKRLYFITKIY